MMKALNILALAPLALAVATPASAALIVCDNQSCEGSTLTSNVLLGNNQSGTTVFGTVNGTGVTFTGSNTLRTQASGAAAITGAGGNPLTGTVTFFLTDGGTFTNFEFNLPGIPGTPPPAEAQSVTFTMLNAAGVAYTSTGDYPTFDMNGYGDNWFSGRATNGDVIKSITFKLNPTNSGVDSLKQVRLGGIAAAAVPEPATWAMLICGFGLVGLSMRRRQKVSVTYA
ncbi:PEPxxWA-CTERM sorting domain-containing protein [Sphingomonas sp. KC8]|nr:PEPxxWA-CTERM sorting domain-containing protein [Sphingomonas sp. KC8]